MDQAALIRRDALMELVKRHRLEFEDICSFYRSKHHRDNGMPGKWLDLARVAI